MEKRISTVDTAKQIRKELKQQLPLTKFSVRSNKRHDLEGINITWEDGYTRKQVEAVVNRFRCFEVNLKTSDWRYPTKIDNFEGEQIIWGASFIDLGRTFSEKFDEDIYCHFDQYARHICAQYIPEYKEALERNLSYAKKHNRVSPYFLEVRTKYYHQIREQISQHDNWLQTTIVIDIDSKTREAACFASNLEADNYVKGEFYYLNLLESLSVCLEGGYQDGIVLSWENPKTKIRYHISCFAEVKDQEETKAINSPNLSAIPDLPATKSPVTEIPIFCPQCGSDNVGSHNPRPTEGNPRFRCRKCNHTFTTYPVGRPSIHGYPMSSTERSRRHRRKLKKQKEEHHGKSTERTKSRNSILL